MSMPPTPSASAAPTPEPKKLGDILQGNLLWFALSLVVTTVVATAAAFLFLEGRVEREMSQKLVPQLGA
jgi:hypothetical protein